MTGITSNKEPTIKHVPDVDDRRLDHLGSPEPGSPRIHRQDESLRAEVGPGVTESGSQGSFFSVSNDNPQ